MYAEENSKLISNLYNAKNRQEISDVLELMGESGDPVFIYPMLDGYTRYKHSSVGYYFIWNLSYLDYPDLGKRLNELLENFEINENDIPMTLFFMAERRFISPAANNIARMYLDYCSNPEFRVNFNLNSVKLSCVLGYMQKAGILGVAEEKMRELIFSGEFNESERTVALYYLLEIDPARHVDFLIANYEKVRGTLLEISLAKRFVLGLPGNGKQLKKLILEHGNDRAVAILEAFDRIAETEVKGKTAYSFVDVVTKIGLLRDQINDKTSYDEQIGFQVFPQSEILACQAVGIDDKEFFLGACRDLLGVIRICNIRVRDYPFDEKESSELLAELPTHRRGSDIVRFLVYLSHRNVSVDHNFFGLKTLSDTIELLLEHEENREFFDKLSAMGIASMYRRKQWHRIHAYLLNAYLQSLENMNKALGHMAQQDLED